MTDDLEVAVAEGSTMVRLGRALFGARPPPVVTGDHGPCAGRAEWTASSRIRPAGAAGSRGVHPPPKPRTTLCARRKRCLLRS